MPLHPVLLTSWLTTAIGEDDAERVRELIGRAANPRQLFGRGTALLTLAAFHGNVDIVQALLDAGADINVVDAESGLSPLSMAASEGKAKAALLLLEAGADPNVYDAGGETPLMAAVKKKRESLIKRLIAAGADVNAVDKAGHTAYSLALERKASEATLQTLLKAGVQSDRGRRTIELAERGATSGWAQRNVDSPPSPPGENEDIAKRRGVGTFDYNNMAVFVRGQVEEVAKALKKIAGASQWQKDVAGREVEIAGSGCFILQFKGHDWSIVLHEEFSEDVKSHAQALSKALATNALYYGISDTAGVLEYTFFEEGQALEYLHSFEGELDFVSSLRETDAEEIESLHGFVHRVFWEQGVFEPGIRFADLIGGYGSTAGNGVTVPSAEYIRRIDLLVLPPNRQAEIRAAREQRLQADKRKAATVERKAKDEVQPTVRRPPARQRREFTDEYILTPKATENLNMRGVRTFQRDNVVMLARSPVSEVADILRQTRGTKRWTKDVERLPTLPQTEASFVFRLRGDDWSVVLDGVLRSDYEKCARAISKQSDNESICLGLCVQKAILIYRWFANGYQLERFQCVPWDCEDHPLLTAFDTKLSGRGLEPDSASVSTQWGTFVGGRDGAIQSLAHSLKSASDTTAEEFVDGLFREQNALEPGITFSDLATLLVGDTPAVPWIRDDFERIDLLVAE